MKVLKHPEAGRLVKAGLFTGLTSFVELEDRIRKLPRDSERQVAFQVFVQAFLATRAVFQAQGVWALAHVPKEVHGRINDEEFVDGVLRTATGEYHAYQVVFDSERRPYNPDLFAQFVAEAGEFDSHLIVTNAGEVRVPEELEGSYYVVRAADFDELQPEDFAAIEAWLRGKRPKLKHYTRQDHQIEAVEKTVTMLKTNDRVQVRMACGSGKSAVGLWTAEALEGVSTVVVFLPSLALVRQLLHEWMEQTIWESVSYLCVCSDATVVTEEDGPGIKRSELDFPVTTNPEVVRQYLRAKSMSVKLVFSTYQSANVVAAGMEEGFAFDLGIFDEAHTTAGERGRSFAFALSDMNLRISKRVFYTATPRHFTVSADGGSIDDKPLFSMDDEAVYGPTAYELSFREAIARAIICDYRVVVSVVTSSMLGAELISEGTVTLLSGERIPAEDLAHMIALQRTIERFGVRRAFTYHKTVAAAKRFVGVGQREVHLAKFLPEHALFHVNGTMSAGSRDSLMQTFREVLQAIMSNAQCLTVGVNVPTVDLVAFIDPRRSIVDIIQAIGRAMRRVAGKLYGYVLIPLYVEQRAGETIEEAVQRSNFRKIWDVLQALREQDHLLASQIASCTWGTGTGPVGGDGDPIVNIVGPEVGFEELVAGIGAVCVGGMPKFFYPTWEEASAATQALKDRPLSSTEYKSGKKYRQDPRLRSNPQHVFADVWEKSGGWAGYLGTAPYKTLDEASSGAQRIQPRVLNGREYRQFLKDNPTFNPRLLVRPDEFYGSVEWKRIGYWPGYLGTIPYDTLDEAAAATQRLKPRLFSGPTYEATLRENPRLDPRLVLQPNKRYGSTEWERIGGWPGYLGVAQHETIEEASREAQSMLPRPKNGAEYRTVLREQRESYPRLRALPREAYGSEAWERIGGWGGYLGKTPYDSVTSAAAASQKLGPRPLTQEEYRELLRDNPQLDMRLPLDPPTYYGVDAWRKIGGWQGYLGTTPHATLEEAADVARTLELTSRTGAGYQRFIREHRSEYPRLVLHPYSYYGLAEWEAIGRWPGFLGTKKR